MMTATTARIVFIGGLSAATASSVQLVEDGFLPKIMAGNGDNGDVRSHKVLPLPEGPDDCGCVLGEGKFCGTDGQCHPYNCEEYYKYGQVEWTGYGSDAPGLECTDIAEQPAETWLDFPGSVSFWCDDDDDADEAAAITMGWTRYCEASAPDTNFTCYELAENTDFQSFLAEADASELECNSGAHNETGYPQYTYSASLSVRRFREYHLGTYTNGVRGFNKTETFDRNKALGGTMNSMFTVNPTPSPTPVMPTPSSSIGTIGKGTFVIIATGFIFGLI